MGLFPPEEYAQLTSSLADMTIRLEDAVHASSDPPPPSSYAVSHLVPTGGRPRIEIDPAFLALALPLRSKERIGHTVVASARTVRRRAIEHGLQVPGLAPFTRIQSESGEITRIHNNVPRFSATNITDEHLQQEIGTILHEFPHYASRITHCKRAYIYYSATA